MALWVVSVRWALRKGGVELQVATPKRSVAGVAGMLAPHLQGRLNGWRGVAAGAR